MKYLVLLAIVLVVLAWLRHQARRGPQNPPRHPTMPPKTGPGPATPQNMVRCARCGLHLPATDALSGADSRMYCSGAHRDQAEA
jgi:uncharacterized protein